ncbi:MAG: hypothetical protein JKY15_02000 [Deltaproteobacteria bacterium]|nr:hypothetical protein [Deltaproteobacteria bacterium]
MGWAKNETVTLTVAGDVMQITDLTAKKFNMFLIHSIASGNISHSIRYNNNSNSVYAQRNASNGGGDGTQVSQTIIDEPLAYANDKFEVQYVCSISGEEKLMMADRILGGTIGSANAPNRGEMVAKFVPSPDAGITRIDNINDQSGDYGVDSNISALSTD